MTSFENLNMSPEDFLQKAKAKHMAFSDSPPRIVPAKPPAKIILPEGQENHKAVLVVDYDDTVNPTRITYDWSAFEIRYKCEGSQVLEIYFYSLDTAPPASIRRFFIRDLKHFGAPVKKIEYFDHSIGDWQEFKAGTYLPDGTDAVRFKFNMKRNPDPNHSYKIDLIAYDVVDKRDIHCDPLVGNDPP